MQRRGRARHVLSTVTALACAATAAITLQAPSAGAATTPPTPDKDPFYAAPANIAALAKGAVIRSRAVTLTAFGLPSNIKAWTLIYKSTDAKNAPVADATTVIVPTTPWTGTGPRPMVSYQAAEDSVGPQCAPSYSLRTSSNLAILTDVVQFASVFDRGWAIAIPDYEGPKSEFIAGVQAGHAVLDGVRAAQSFKPSGLTKATPVGLWGYSGGGQATAWASELQGTYAPDLKIAGTSEGGVPADVQAVVKYIDGGLFAGFEFAGIIGLNRAYPEMNLNAVVNAAGATALGNLKSACETDILAAMAFKKIDDLTLVPNTIAQPVYQKVIKLNGLAQNKPVAPVFNYHATPDEIIPVGPTNTMISKYCAAGVKVVSERYVFGDHVTGALQGKDNALNFLADRFAGKPVVSTC